MKLHTVWSWCWKGVGVAIPQGARNTLDFKFYIFRWWPW